MATQAIGIEGAKAGIWESTECEHWGTGLFGDPMCNGDSRR